MSPTRLYLVKDTKQDLYVDFQKPPPQHQIDGVRFLYRQFKKKKPGVILNDPSGYGKRLQAVLFLEAVRPALDKPIFIICDDCDVDGWKEHFVKWTSFSVTDLAINTTNAFAKYNVFINTVKDAQNFFRRNWSIVIVQDSSFDKNVMQTAFKADFKIWLTSVDMKENLQIFSMIDQWFDAKTKIDIKDLIPNKNSPKDVITKSIILEAFLEDVVLRRNYLMPLKKPEDQISRKSKQVNVEHSPKKVSRKNKDPTGTKVKRSRKRIIDDDEPEDATMNRENTNISIDCDEMNNVVINNELPIGDKSQSDSNEMDVENFIRYSKPVNSDGFKDFITEFNSPSQNNDIPNSDRNNQIEFENSDNELTSNSLYDCQNAINEIVDNENEVIEDNNRQSAINTEYDTDTAQNMTDSDESQNSFTIINTRNNKTKENIIIPETEETEANLTEDIDNNEKNELNIKDTSNDSNCHKTSLDIEESTECDVKKNIELDKNVSSSHKDIDDKLSYLEEQALKKFKGSLLDSIF